MYLVNSEITPMAVLWLKPLRPNPLPPGWFACQNCPLSLSGPLPQSPVPFWRGGAWP